MKFPLERNVESEETRKAELHRSRSKLTKLIHSGRRKSGAPDHGVGDVEFLQLAEQRSRNPGLEEVGRVPGQRSGHLVADNEAVEREIYSLVGNRPRALIGDQ